MLHKHSRLKRIVAEKPSSRVYLDDWQIHSEAIQLFHSNCASDDAVMRNEIVLSFQIIIKKARLTSRLIFNRFIRRQQTAQASRSAALKPYFT